MPHSLKWDLWLVDSPSKFDSNCLLHQIQCFRLFSCRHIPLCDVINGMLEVEGSTKCEHLYTFATKYEH